MQCSAMHSERFMATLVGIEFALALERQIGYSLAAVEGVLERRYCIHSVVWCGTPRRRFLSRNVKAHRVTLSFQDMFRSPTIFPFFIFASPTYYIKSAYATQRLCVCLPISSHKILCPALFERLTETPPPRSPPPPPLPLPTRLPAVELEPIFFHAASRWVAPSLCPLNPDRLRCKARSIDPQILSVGGDDLDLE